MSGFKTASDAVRRGARGFTLIEMVVVIGIASVLLALATLGFQSMNDKYKVESQVKQMQADIDNLRLTAMTTKQRCCVQLNPNSYTFLSYSSDSDPGHPPPGMQNGAVALQFPIQQFSNGSYSDLTGTLLSIDARGCLTSPGAPYYIAVAPGVPGVQVNALALQTAKTNIGLIQGGSCVLQ